MSETALEQATAVDAELLESCRRFVAFLSRTGYESFDPYDIWGTRPGLWARRQYYRHGNLCAPLVAPFVAMDLLCPGARRLFVRKQRFATADAQVLLGLLNLHAVTGDHHYLDRAVSLGDEIMAYSIRGYKGPCWGYPFDWQNGKGATWTRNTPYITCTPYCYEAFIGLHDATGEARYHAIARGISEFVARDLRDSPHSDRASAGSYSPHDNSKVVNASAYRAWLLIDSGRRFAEPGHLEIGLRNLNFVLETQREDGAWLYAIDAGASFIDNFHTCFNLKNLAKINRFLAREDIARCIQRGFEYYRTHLLYANGDPKSFAVEPRFQVTRLELYNFAEGITLCSLLSRCIPGASAIGWQMARRLVRDFQRPDGHFVTRVFRGGIRHTFPFLRWPQAQLFLALTNMLRLSASQPGTPERIRDGSARSAVL